MAPSHFIKHRMTSFTCSSKQDSMLYSAVWLGMQTCSTGYWKCTDDDHGNVCRNLHYIFWTGVHRQYPTTIFIVYTPYNDYSTHLNYQGGHTTLQHHYYENSIIQAGKISNSLVLGEMFQCHHRSCNQTRWLQYPVQTLYDWCMTWTQKLLWGQN